MIVICAELKRASHWCPFVVNTKIPLTSKEAGLPAGPISSGACWRVMIRLTTSSQAVQLPWRPHDLGTSLLPSSSPSSWPCSVGAFHLQPVGNLGFGIPYWLPRGFGSSNTNLLHVNPDPVTASTPTTFSPFSSRDVPAASSMGVAHLSSKADPNVSPPHFGMYQRMPLWTF